MDVLINWMVESCHTVYIKSSHCVLLNILQFYLSDLNKSGEKIKIEQ